MIGGAPRNDILIGCVGLVALVLWFVLLVIYYTYRT